MRQVDENYVSMCKAVQEVLNNHSAEWGGMLMFKQQVVDLEALMDAVAMAMEGAEIVSTGATKGKEMAKMAAIVQAVNLSKRARVYALEVNNMEWYAQLRVSKTELLRRSDTLCLAKLRDIYTRIAALGGAVADYGIDAAAMAELQVLSDAYGLVLSKPRSLIVARKGYNQDALPKLLSRVRKVLHKIDNLINVYSDSVLERSYKDARIIQDLGRRSGGKAAPIVPEA